MGSYMRNMPLGLRFIFLFCLIVITAGAFATIGYLSIHSLFGIARPEDAIEGKFTEPNSIYAFLYIQALYSLGAFLVSSLLYARLISAEPVTYLGAHKSPGLKWILLATVSVVIAQFFISFLIEMNRSIQLPPNLSFLRDQQEKLAELTKAILTYTGFTQFIVTALVLAVIPAIGEELLFRGVILGDLLKANIHPAISIVASGICFAVAHFEFDNTIAIGILGCFLGYLYYTSGNLWVPIAAHFVNNLLTVLFKYLFNTGVIGADVAEADAPMFATLISVALFAGCIFIFNKWKQAHNPVFEPEEMDLPHQSENL